MRRFVILLPLLLALWTDLLWARSDAGTLALPDGRGLILPIQDRAGSPETTEFLDLLVRQDLSRLGSELGDGIGLRDTLRRLRVREVATSTSEELLQLSQLLEFDWLVSITLHELVREAIPKVTLSAQIFRPAKASLDWSGFVSVTGLDRETWLGLGRIDSADDLLRLATRLLFADFDATAPRRPKARIRKSRGGFLRGEVTPESSGPVAVVPFESLVDREPFVVAELHTRAWLAALVSRGFDVVRPGAVHQVMRGQNRLLLGEVDLATATSIADEIGAEWVLSGTVETYQAGSGLQPRPWVAVGARLVHSRSGQIHWIDGLEQRGSDTDGLFQRGRVYSAATLSLGMAQSLIGEFTSPPRYSQSP